MSTAPHILVVDDEPAVRELIGTYLGRQGLRISAAVDGEAMRRVLAAGGVDLVILDLVMPGEDGLTLTRYLRHHEDVGIIMLTGRGEVVDRIVGLEVGADDYLAKPFDLRELLARVRSVLRRSDQKAPGTKDSRFVRFAGWRLDRYERRLLSPRGEDPGLTAGEFDLLCAFVDHPHRVLNRDQLLDITHGRMAGPFDRSIDVQVGRLRRKIEADPDGPTLIKTVRGKGYLFTAEIDTE